MIAIENGHVVERAAKPLPWPAAAELAEQLGREGIDVLIEAGPVVHVIALLPCSTWQEQRALAVVMAATDARVAWHGVPVCPIHGAGTPTEGCSLCGRAGREVAR